MQNATDDEAGEEHVTAVHCNEVVRVDARNLELEDGDHDERGDEAVYVSTYRTSYVQCHVEWECERER